MVRLAPGDSGLDSLGQERNVRLSDFLCAMRPRPAVNGLSRCDSNFMQSVQWRRRENRESGNIVNVNVMPAAVTCVIDREGKGCCDRDCLWSKRSGVTRRPGFRGPMVASLRPS